MRVDWRIQDDVISCGILGTNTFVDIARQNGVFEAILGTQGYTDSLNPYWRRRVITRKKDNSLLELMNWAEEELKFRESHGK
jgi:hypothetical protein